MERIDLAQDEFEGYDFGEGVQVIDHGKWCVDDSSDLTKIVYLEFDEDGPEDDLHRANFHVRFNDEGGVAEVYALDLQSGNEIGVPMRPEGAPAHRPGRIPG